MGNNIPPELRNYLTEINKLAHLKFSINEVRLLSENLTIHLSLPKIKLPMVEDKKFKLGAHSISVRIYHPDPEKELGLMFYLHGGGHACGSLETHDNICRRLAKQCNRAVIALNYRLAPEYPYPAGLNDCTWVFNHLDKIASDLPINTEQLFIAGDSAGGNLAATLTHNAKLKGDEKIKGLALIYPSVDFTMQFDSIKRNGEGYLLTKEKMTWYFDHYFSGDNLDRVTASPIHFKHLENLPPTYIAVAEFDPLIDEGIALANTLKSLNVPTELEVFQGMIHGFIQLEKLVPTEINRLIVSISKFIESTSNNCHKNP